MRMYVQQNLPPYMYMRCLEWWLTHCHDRQTFFYPPDAVEVLPLLMFMLFLSSRISLYYPWSCLECAWVCGASWLPIWSTVQLPIVVEFLGDLAEDGIFMVRAIGKAMHLPPQYYRYPCHLHAWVNFFSICIAISLWRGNACLWLNQHLTLCSWVYSVVWHSITFQLPVSLFSNIPYRWNFLRCFYLDAA